MKFRMSLGDALRGSHGEGQEGEAKFLPYQCLLFSLFSCERFRVTSQGKGQSYKQMNPGVLFQLLGS